MPGNAPPLIPIPRSLRPTLPPRTSPNGRAAVDELTHMLPGTVLESEEQAAQRIAQGAGAPVEGGAPGDPMLGAANAASRTYGAISTVASPFPDGKNLATVGVVGGVIGFVAKKLHDAGSFLRGSTVVSEAGALELTGNLDMASVHARDGNVLGALGRGLQKAATPVDKASYVMQAPKRVLNGSFNDMGDGLGNVQKNLRGIANPQEALRGQIASLEEALAAGPADKVAAFKLQNALTEANQQLDVLQGAAPGGIKAAAMNAAGHASEAMERTGGVVSNLHLSDKIARTPGLNKVADFFVKRHAAPILKQAGALNTQADEIFKQAMQTRSQAEYVLATQGEEAAKGLFDQAAQLGRQRFDMSTAAQTMTERASEFSGAKDIGKVAGQMNVGRTAYTGMQIAATTASVLYIGNQYKNDYATAKELYVAATGADANQVHASDMIKKGSPVAGSIRAMTVEHGGAATLAVGSNVAFNKVHGALSSSGKGGAASFLAMTGLMAAQGLATQAFKALGAKELDAFNKLKFYAEYGEQNFASRFEHHLSAVELDPLAKALGGGDAEKVHAAARWMSHLARDENMTAAQIVYFTHNNYDEAATKGAELLAKDIAGAEAKQTAALVPDTTTAIAEEVRSTKPIMVDVPASDANVSALYDTQHQQHREELLSQYTGRSGSQPAELAR